MTERQRETRDRETERHRGSEIVRKPVSELSKLPAAWLAQRLAIEADPAAGLTRLHTAGLYCKCVCFFKCADGRPTCLASARLPVGEGAADAGVGISTASGSARRAYGLQY